MAKSQIKLSRGQYLVSAQELVISEKELPSLGSDEVQIAIKSTTLCGSDIHYYQHGRNGTIRVREPLCLGHEAAGEIVAVGEDADFCVGDRVAIECGIPCGSCQLCKEQRYNLCGELRFRGSGSAWPHFQGTMQDVVNHPAKWTHRLPMTLSYEEGALLEPLAVAIHACRRAQLRKGSSCTIIGAGAIGLLCAVAARMEGCAHVAIADIASDRVQFAIDNAFADVGHVVSAKKASDLSESLDMAKSIAKAIENLHVPGGIQLGKTDYTFECTGVPSCVQTSIYVTKSGGKVMLVGMGTPNHTLPISEASAREIDIVPTWRYADCYERSIEIFEETKKDQSLPQMARIITHRFTGLEAVAEALQTACKAQDEKGAMVIKVVLNEWE